MTSATEVSAARETRAARTGASGKSARRRGGRRARGQAANGVRYFVGQPAKPDGKPTLEQEIGSEPEALVIAFKKDHSVYLVSEYRVTEKIDGDQVRLEKEPVSAAHSATKGFSTTNAS